MKNIGKRFCAFILCCVLGITAASAATNYSDWTKNVSGPNGIKYHGRTSITVSNGMVSSTATMVTTDSTALPAGYVKVWAELYRGNALSSYGGPVSNAANKTGATAQTGKASGNGNYHAEGTAEYTNKNGGTSTLELLPVTYSMSSRAIEPFTADEREVKTNSLNQSYGEAFVAKKMNLDLDLISAVGQNGVEGYIYSSELPHNIANYVPYDHEINVYASDGITVVDSFYISAGTPDSAE